MQITIKIKDGLCSLQIKEGKQALNWNEMTRKEQLIMLNALGNQRNLFLKFLKDE